jgi:HEAT repeat protein
MAELKDPESAAPLMALVGHANAFVRASALRGLKELRRRDALKPALDSLRDAEQNVRIQAVSVIGFLKLEETVPALTAATTDASPQVRRAAVNALAFSHVGPASQAIVRALGDPDWSVREVAAETLASSPDGASAELPLIESLNDSFWQVRLKATRSLGRFRSRRAVAPIGACLQHSQANLRKEAAAALGEIADPAGLPFLAAVIDDPDPEVRKNARWAVQQIDLTNAR